MFKILVIEDDRNIRKLIMNYLTNDGNSVTEAEDGMIGLEKFNNNFFDLIITDIMMPKLNGIELTRIIRETNKDIPILMLTAKESYLDKREGFGSGADDYIVKPADMDEMLLRIYALLRRSKYTSEKKINYNKTVVDYTTNTVTSGDLIVELPKKEFLLLFKLLSSPDRIFTRLELMDEIWGYDNESDERTVDVHIKRVREKLVSITDFEIVTVRGLGYKAVIK